MRPASVLIVDPDSSMRRSMETILSEEGFQTSVAERGKEALTFLKSIPSQLVFSEIILPDVDGMAFLREVKLRWPLVSFIVVTAIREVTAIVQAMKRGAVNYLLKPPARAAVLGAVREALAQTQDAAARHSPRGMIGESIAMAKVYEMIAIASQSQLNVMITGETGTGKELVAEAIHQGSQSGSRPFIKQNCAAIPRDLFEGEFFGHRRGAFTGAIGEQIGLLEQADGSDLFLDEIEAMNPEHQAKLLRAIEDGQVRPVGGQETRRVTVRYLAATNRNPQDLIVGGKLRDDLYYRLRGLSITLPSLRDRVDDIPLLARHFLDGYSVAISPEAMTALRAYHWPGNVRELKNVVLAARAVAAAAGASRVLPTHLAICEKGIQDAADKSSEAPHREHVRRVERGLILDALQAVRGNRSLAAMKLGMDRTTLWRKLRSLGIE